MSAVVGNNKCIQHAGEEGLSVLYCVGVLAVGTWCSLVELYHSCRREERDDFDR